MHAWRFELRTIVSDSRRSRSHQHLQRLEKHGRLLTTTHELRLSIRHRSKDPIIHHMHIRFNRFSPYEMPKEGLIYRRQ